MAVFDLTRGRAVERPARCSGSPLPPFVARGLAGPKVLGIAGRDPPRMVRLGRGPRDVMAILAGRFLAIDRAPVSCRGGNGIVADCPAGMRCVDRGDR
jgi:hypothetical protein